jgi:hypothetical protein
VFLADLLNEMSYTIPDAIENTQLLQKKVPISMIQEFSTEEANAFVKNANKLANKFPAASKEVLAPVQDHLKTFLIRTMHEGQQDARSLIPLVESKKAVLNEMIRLRKLNPNMQQWGMYADLVLSQPKDIQGSKEYLKAIVSQMNRGGLTEVPSRFHEIAMKVDDPEAIDAIAGWLSDPKNSHLKNVGSDAELLHWIAEKKPEQKNKIFAPLREYYANKIAENNFGRKDFYKTTILFDHLNEIVPESEKKEFLQNMLNKVHSAFPEVEHPDRLIFSEKIEKYLNQDLQPVSRGSCLTRFSSQLKQIFRK